MGSYSHSMALCAEAKHPGNNLRLETMCVKTRELLHGAVRYNRGAAARRGAPQQSTPATRSARTSKGTAEQGKEQSKRQHGHAHYYQHHSSTP